MSKPGLVPHWLYGLFMRIAEPRITRLMHFVIYVVSLLGGISAWTTPPISIEGVLGSTLTTLWGAFLIVGGICGAASVLQGVWWVERIAVLALATGLSIYCVVVLGLEFTHPGTRQMQLTVIAVALISLLIRWVGIRRYAYDPER